jgi:16S rRNA C1402 N4-methylase RsmH
MKMNIKLGMKNETDRQITRHSLPTRICFNFFYPPHKNFEMPTHIAHIAKAPQANAKTKALSKSAILPTLEEETKKRYLYA